MVAAAGPSIGPKMVSAPGPSNSKVATIDPAPSRASRMSRWPTRNQRGQLGNVAVSKARTAGRSAAAAGVMVTPALAARSEAAAGGR